MKVEHAQSPGRAQVRSYSQKDGFVSDHPASSTPLPGTTPLVAIALMEMAVSIVCKKTGDPFSRALLRAAPR